MTTKKSNLEELDQLENQAKGIEESQPIPEQPVIEEHFEKVPKIIEGYKILESYDMPFGGVFYPASWKFAYRCPTSKEVANFSTINEQDQPSIISTIEELIRACYVIVDSESNAQISSSEINDGERLFFFLKLREFYLHDKPITYLTMSSSWQEPVEVNLVAAGLEFPKINDKLLACFDGRMFNIPVTGLDNPIRFLMPTLEISSRIFRYMIKTYKESQKETSDNMKDSEAFNKQFLMLAPFLYETGKESVESLKLKFKNIQKDDKLLTSYLTVINKIQLTNLDKINYTYRGSEEEALIKFPGGWKNMFINTEDFGGIFE